jgi:hypothetical protein
MSRGTRSVGFQRRQELTTTRDAVSLGEGQVVGTGFVWCSPALGKRFSTPFGRYVLSSREGAASVDQALQALPCPRGRRPPQPTPGGRRELMWVPSPFDATLEGSRIAGIQHLLLPRPRESSILRCCGLACHSVPSARDYLPPLFPLPTMKC